MLDLFLAQVTEQLDRAGKGTPFRHQLLVNDAVPLLQLLGLAVRERAADLVARRLRQQAAAHPDEPVHLPAFDRHPRFGEHPLPRERVAVDRVDERPIEVENHRTHLIRIPDNPLMHSAVTLFDVDNTLLDNDRVVADLMRFMDRELGHARRDDYWQIFETLRTELGYADYLGALQRYRALHPRDSHVLAVSQFLVNYPFANRLFPESLDAIDHARAWGPVAVLTDGDVVFQPRKIERSGLFDAVDRHILIYVHKELELDDVEQRYPAEHYVVVDDKLWLLDAMKKHWGDARDDGVAAGRGTTSPTRACRRCRRRT